MTKIKAGDLVTLKSGGPTMTVDTVNTDIFDDDTITGVLCVWFVGDRLERVRFDHRAIEPAPVRAAVAPQEVCEPDDLPAPKRDARAAQEATGDYKAVLDNMAGAMNAPTDHLEVAKPKPAKRPRSSPRAGIPGSTH